MRCRELPTVYGVFKVREVGSGGWACPAGLWLGRALALLLALSAVRSAVPAGDTRVLRVCVRGAGGAPWPRLCHRRCQCSWTWW